MSFLITVAGERCGQWLLDLEKKWLSRSFSRRRGRMSENLDG